MSHYLHYPQGGEAGYRSPSPPPRNSQQSGSRPDEIFLDQQRDVVGVFGQDVFCQFEARVPEFNAVFSVHCTLPQLSGEGLCANSGTLAPNTTTTSLG
jgi:hypothetical protein